MNIRPHHALCAQFFVGKGDSEQFVEHMARTLSELNRGDTPVMLTDGCDTICAGCPNRTGNVCETEEKARAIDCRAIAAMGLRYGDTVPWRELCARAKDRIIAPGRLFEVCGDCEWIGVCTDVSERRK